MKENKTKQTEASVDDYLAAIADDARRADCAALVKLMSKATTFKPKMWGTSIVGFGSYHYKYESGREGYSCLVGFSSRKGDISIYLTASYPGQEEFMAKLGKHKMATACLYIKRLNDVDTKVLAQMVAASTRQRQLQNV
jgi:Domain of unknown function (DU1801)